MIKFLGSFLILSLFLVSLSQAAEIDAESSIKTVTIYPGSAKVTRRSEVSVPAGISTIIVKGLPANFNQSSLRVTGEAQQAVSLGNVELSKKIEEEVVYEKERTLKQKIEEVKQERLEVQDALTRNKSQLEYIRTMVIGDGIKPRKDNDDGYKNSYSQLPLEQWQQAWDTLDSATARVQEKIRTAQKELKDFDKQIKKLEAELRQVAVSRQQPSTHIARMQIEATQATDLVLNISYQINGARWSPIYDADLNTQNGKVVLKTLAKINQRTGEDWSDVKLTLSTLRPGAGTQLPVLNSWVLDFMQEPVPYARGIGSASAPPQLDMAAPMVESLEDQRNTYASKRLRKAMKPKRAMVAQESSLSVADFSAEYMVPGLISLKSGSDSRRFVLGAQTLESKIQLAAAPRFDPRAMILSTIKYKGETPLLAGNVSLYRNASFVGNTYLKQILPSEEIKLSFGEDDKVKITFQPDPDKKRKDGILFGKRKVVERHYQTSISSQHDKPYSITLYDVLPVAADENIKVKKIGESPDKTDIDDKKGVVSWIRNISSAKKIKLKYGYTVSYPEDRRIMGL